MKIIFLDIDGVLNVMNDYLLKQADKPSQRDQYGSSFHPHFVANLKHIIDKTNAFIVISSTWRFSGLKIMKEMWSKRQLPGKVVDITTTDTRFNGHRGKEIQEYLKALSNDDKYVIFDDDIDMLPHQIPFFVRTSNNLSHTDYVGNGFGLTKECAEKAIQILNS